MGRQWTVRKEFDARIWKAREQHLKVEIHFDGIGPVVGYVGNLYAYGRDESGLIELDTHDDPVHPTALPRDRIIAVRVIPNHAASGPPANGAASVSNRSS